MQVRRVYEEPDPRDGVRILVDRIWPRGMTKSAAHLDEKSAAHLDEWCKQIAPSTELRTWYHHEPTLLAEFIDRYQVELQAKERAAALEHLRILAKTQTLTLLTATKQPDLSHARVLADLLHA